MLKKGIPFLIILFVITGIVYIKYSQKPADESAPEQKEQEIKLPDEFGGLKKSAGIVSEDFERFIMDNEYFLCDIPKAWEFSKTDEKNNEKGVFGLELLGPRTNNAPTLVRIKFYLEGNAYFSGYTEFIESNSKDIFGDTETETDKYWPVEKIKLNGRTAYRFEREVKEYTNLESSSGEFTMLKEKFYVIPSEKGFHILHFMSSSSAYLKYLPIFEDIAYSFRGV
ncbi:MAG: hypothetical protein L6420_07070 [Elusimicrobia bacterium]|nr:hypothetical protein [Elusimicrobiota bacterium]